MPTLDQATPGLPEGVVEITYHSLVASYAAEGYEQGYARGARDLLALYPLLMDQFLRDRAGVSVEVRRAVREFGRYVQDHVGRRLDDAGFIDGSGI